MLYYMLGILVIPGILLSLYAQIKVNYNFSKYSSINSIRNIRACDLVRDILDRAGLYDVKLVTISGDSLDNYYNPRKNLIALSNDVYYSTSISALGIACHEVGHALQYAENYFPIKFRNAVIPTCNFISKLLYPIIFIGLLFLYIDTNSLFGSIFLYSGITFFGISVFLNLLALPIENDASNRAIILLNDLGVLDNKELKGAKKVLRSAGFTYIAVFITSLLNLLRFLLAFRRRD